MIFYMDISSDDLSSVSEATLTAAVSDLVRAHRVGHHLVVISRPTATWLASNIDLSERDTAMLARISQEYAQTGDLRRRAKPFINVSANEASNLAVTASSITVSLGNLVQYRLLDQPILLVENLESDGALYDFLLRTHGALHECKHISFESQHGGGGDLVMVFKHKMDERRIVCTVFDSDRNAPASGNGKLAVLIEAKEDLRWPLGFPVSPPCREAENIVPMELVMTLPSGVRNAANSIHLNINKHELAQGHPLEEHFWLFFDLKEGIKPDKFGRLAPDERIWIEAKLRLDGIDPTVQKVEGYGNNIIRQIVAEHKFVGELRKLTRRTTWRRVFSPFLEELVWVLAATTRVMT
jgi:hypothetical protein